MEEGPVHRQRLHWTVPSVAAAEGLQVIRQQAGELRCLEQMVREAVVVEEEVGKGQS